MKNDAELVKRISKLPKNEQGIVMQKIAERRGGSTSAFKQFVNEAKGDFGLGLAKNAGSALYDTVRHPIDTTVDTAKNIAGVGLSGVSTALGGASILQKYALNPIDEITKKAGANTLSFFGFNDSAKKLREYNPKSSEKLLELQKGSKKLAEDIGGGAGFTGGEIAQFFGTGGESAILKGGKLKSIAATFIKNIPEQTLKDVSLSQSQSPENDIKSDILFSVLGQGLGAGLAVKSARKLALAKKEVQDLAKKEAQALAKKEAQILLDSSVEGIEKQKKAIKMGRPQKLIKKELKKETSIAGRRKLQNELSKEIAKEKELLKLSKQKKIIENSSPAKPNKQKRTAESKLLKDAKKTRLNEIITELNDIEHSFITKKEFDLYKDLSVRIEKKGISEEEVKTLKELKNKVKQSLVNNERKKALELEKENLFKQPVTSKKQEIQESVVKQEDPVVLKQEKAQDINLLDETPEPQKKIKENPKNKFFAKESKTHRNSFNVEDNFEENLIKNSTTKPQDIKEKGKIRQIGGDIYRGIKSFQAKSNFYKNKGLSKFYDKLTTTEVESKRIAEEIKSYGDKLRALSKRSKERVALFVKKSQGKDPKKHKLFKKLFPNGELVLTKKEMEAVKDFDKGIDLYARTIDSPYIAILTKNKALGKLSDEEIKLIDNYRPISTKLDLRRISDEAKDKTFIQNLKQRADFAFSRKKGVDINTYELDYSKVYDKFADQMGTMLARGKIAEMSDMFKLDALGENDLLKKVGVNVFNKMKSDFDEVLGQGQQKEKLVTAARKIGVWKFIAARILTPARQFAQTGALLASEHIPKAFKGTQGFTRAKGFKFDPKKIGLKGGDISYSDVNDKVLSFLLKHVKTADYYSKNIIGNISFNEKIKEAQKAGKVIDDKFINKINREILDSIDRRFGSAGGVSMPHAYKSDTIRLLTSFMSPATSFTSSYIEDVANAQGKKEVSKAVVKGITALTASAYINDVIDNLEPPKYKTKAEFSKEMVKQMVQSTALIGPIVWALSSQFGKYDPIAFNGVVNGIIDDWKKVQKGKMSYAEFSLRSVVPDQLPTSYEGLKAYFKGGSKYGGKFIKLPKEKGVFNKSKQIFKLTAKGANGGNDNIKRIKDKRFNQNGKSFSEALGTK